MGKETDTLTCSWKSNMLRRIEPFVTAVMVAIALVLCKIFGAELK